MLNKRKEKKDHDLLGKGVENTWSRNWKDWNHLEDHDLRYHRLRESSTAWKPYLFHCEGDLLAGRMMMCCRLKVDVWARRMMICCQLKGDAWARRMRTCCQVKADAWVRLVMGYILESRKPTESVLELVRNEASCMETLRTKSQCLNSFSVRCLSRII